MTEQVPGQPNDDVVNWPELSDPQIDQGIRDDLLELSTIDESRFWDEDELSLRLDAEPNLAPSLWLGYQMLLESHGFEKNSDVLQKFDELSDSFTGQKPADMAEKIKDINELRNYLLLLGFTASDLSAKETLKRAYFGKIDDKGEEAMRMIHRATRDDASLRKTLEDFDRDAKKQEGRD